MIDEYICKIATAEDMEQNWNYLIEIHPDNNAWKIWKEKAIKDMENENAIILNTDELTYAMFDNEQGDKYTDLANRANEYLLKKAVELVKIGCNVILDWGFWRKYNRGYVSEYFKNENIKVEWHYINIDDISWEQNIEKRNRNINAGMNKTDFYVTEGLKKKLLDNWEEPSKDEIDVWYDFKR